MTAISELRKIEEAMKTQEKIQVNQETFFGLLVRAILELVPAGFPVEPTAVVVAEEIVAPEKKKRAKKVPVIK